MGSFSTLELAEADSSTVQVLPESFRLTKFGKLTSKSAIVPKEFYEKWIPQIKTTKPIPTQAVVEALEVIVPENSTTSNQNANESVIYQLVYPIVDDPLKSGKIACASLLSKLFLNGIYECEKINFMIGVCNKWSDQERDSVKSLVFKGFQNIAEQIKANVIDVGLFSTRFCMFGGYIKILSSINLRNNMNVMIGDVIVLTKPIGASLAIEAFKILEGERTEKRSRLISSISAEDIRQSYNDAIQSMISLNSRACMLAEKYEIHALIEINGKSLMEHAQELAEQQLNEVSFHFYNLPILTKVVAISKLLSKHNDLIQGNLTEISGGILLIMQREQAAGFCKNFNNTGPDHAWIIGVAENGDRKAHIIKKPRIIEWLRRI